MTERELLELIVDKITSMEEKPRRVEESQLLMEDELISKVKVLFDAREVQLDVNDRIIEALSRIEGKLDRLSLKVASHDSLLKKVK